MHDLSSIIHSSPEILDGTSVSLGTRVPVRILMEYLAAGDGLEDFLQAFPSVRRDQTVAALEIAEQILTSGTRSS
jgi:uncharacterized protein (DUF433 family)